MKNLHPRTKPIGLLTAACLALACFSLAPQARATCQEGCLTNQNTVLGDDALLSNTGVFNTAIGFNALSGNTSGGNNTAVGYQALFSNTSGISNTAIGWKALLFNTTGSVNTAIGLFALVNNTTGQKNTATGVDALFSNTTGDRNTVIGWGALQHNTTGKLNVGVGHRAGFELTSGSGNIDISNNGVAGESSTIRIGTVRAQTATYIAGISGATVPTGVGVIVDADGHLGTVVSSARFKESIRPMDKASEAILSLEPVTFRYKKDLDPKGVPQFGLVAEQVEKVDPDLVARDQEGKPYTVRYEAVNSMLLNEFLKEHRKVEALEGTVAAQKKGFESQIAALTTALKAQAAQIQKVSDQLKTQAAVPRVVAND